MRIILYTNILTPYRKYFFDVFYEKCKKQNIDFIVLIMAESESNRNWSYDDYKAEYTDLLAHKTFSYKNIFIHYNPTLKKKIEELKPSIVICAGSYLCPGIYRILKMSDKFNYKTYFWSESHLNEIRDYSFIKIKLRDILRKKIYEKFDGFWYAGKLSLEFIEKYADIDCKKIFVPNIVDNKIFDYHNFSSDKKKDILKKYNLDNCKITFICPARLTYVKGIDKFLDLISTSKLSSKITILLPGSGELEDVIRDKAINYNIDIRILGFLNQKEVAKLYAISDFFLMPSLSDPNPLTCIEALWEGLPLLVSEHVGNCKEVVCENLNGFIFDYKDSKKMDFILSKIIAWSKNDYANAKKYSYNLAKTTYMSENVVDRICSEMGEG
ncbi:glycosyltransferase family 4 protein [Thomasclavelia cocleata]|uniref:glycosyltransferase family 4 protein n=1 Tax=Thomasclavelia cocleata TaxID=69824 RepID=UPI00242F7DB3|nr:glycosyltransferase family 4 protein [Thomasclavelia cocleata]